MEGKNYSVIYFLTWDCNMSCSYCYETIRKAQNMTWDVARDGIDFFMNKYEKVHFQFFGGEPLLQFKLMRSMTEYLNKNYKDRYGLSIYTNGTLITEETLEFFAKNRVFVTLSMDGAKTTQDLNRKLKNGKDSYNLLHPIIQKLLDRKISLRIRMTVTPNNCEHLFENIKFWVDNYSIMDIQEEIDRYALWSEDKIEVLVGQYKLLVEYLVACYKKDTKFSWKNFEKRVYPYVDQSGRYQIARCGSSERMCSMDTDGLLYPCQKFIVNHTLSIGSIYEGFNTIQRDIVRNYVLPNYLQETRKCVKCEYVNFCFAGCIAENYIQDTNQIQDCRFRKLHKGMHKKFYDELSYNNIDIQSRYINSKKMLALGDDCGSEGCGMEGGCGSEGCGGEGCGSEGCGAEFNSFN
jgi:uncharacterized protein